MSEKAKLIVNSAHDKATPPNGYDNYDKGQVISCSVTSPVTEDGIDWKCTGWQGTGSVPKQGEGAQVSFPLIEDSSITWIWKRQMYKLSLAQWATIITFIVIVVLSAGMYEASFALPMVAFAGAIGGLLHEIVQSQGKFILPTTDNTGNFCFGGLIGVIVGAIAGFILYQGVSAGSSGVSGMLFAEAFLAGLAAKGVTDAVQPPQKSSSGTQQQTTSQQTTASEQQ